MTTLEMKRILLPTDFSDNSAVATRYACAFAERFNAELHLLHVLEVHLTAVPEFGMGLAIPSSMKESIAAVEKALAGVLDGEWAADKSIVQAVVEGSPFVQIIRYAKEHEIDLIVMGSHGRTGLAHALIGSVAERVVRKSSCPVLTARPGGHQFVMP